MSDLEDTLRRKLAAQRAADAQKVAEQEAQVAETKRIQEKIAEETRIAELRHSIIVIDAKTGEMQSFLAELEEAHKQTGTLAAGKEEGRKGLNEATRKIEGIFADSEMRKVLATEGITSVEELLETEEYQKHREVQSIRALRESHPKKRASVEDAARAMRETKGRAYEAVARERPDTPRTYKEIVAALKALIQTLGHERQALFYQTPEGQEALKTEIKNRMAERHPHASRMSKNEISRYSTVEAGDLQDGAQYGEKAVKDALKSHYGEVIDARCAEEAEQAGIPQLEKALQTIEALPSRWQKIRGDFTRVQNARRQTIYRLSGLLGNDVNAPLFRLINNYGHWGIHDAEILAERFVDAYSGHSATALGFDTNTAEVGIERIISEQEKMMQSVQSGQRKDLFPRTNIDARSFSSYPIETKLENPERAAILLGELEAFYRRFQSALTTPEETLAKMEGREGNFTKELDIKSQYDLGLAGGRSEIERMLEFDPKIYVALRDTPLAELKLRLKRQQEAIAKDVKTLKEQTADKVDADWASSELMFFRNAEGNKLIIQAAERTVRMKGIAERLSPQLDTAVAQAEAYMGETVSLTKNGDLEFIRAPHETIRRLQKEVETADQQIRNLNARIQDVEDRAAIEGDGLLGGKKRKREKEKKDLEAEKRPLEERRETLRIELQPLNEMDGKLGGISSWLYDAKRQGLAFTQPQSPIALRELIETVKQQTHFELTPEQSRVHEQYRKLEEKRTEAAKRYEKWDRQSF